MHLEGLATEFLPAVSPGQSCMSLARLESWRMGPSIRKASVRGMTAVKKKWSLGEEWFCSVMLLWHDLPNIPHNHNVYIAKKCSEILECLPVLCVLLIEHHWTSKILEWNSTRTQIIKLAGRHLVNVEMVFDQAFRLAPKSQRLEPHDLQSGQQETSSVNALGYLKMGRWRNWWLRRFIAESQSTPEKMKWLHTWKLWKRSMAG